MSRHKTHHMFRTFAGTFCWGKIKSWFLQLTYTAYVCVWYTVHYFNTYTTNIIVTTHKWCTYKAIFCLLNDDDNDNSTHEALLLAALTILLVFISLFQYILFQCFSQNFTLVLLGCSFRRLCIKLKLKQKEKYYKINKRIIYVWNFFPLEISQKKIKINFVLMQTNGSGWELPICCVLPTNIRSTRCKL